MKKSSFLVGLLSLLTLSFVACNVPTFGGTSSSENSSVSSEVTSSSQATSSSEETSSSQVTSSSEETSSSSQVTSSSEETSSSQATSSSEETSSSQVTSSSEETSSSQATSSSEETSSSQATSSSEETSSSQVTSSSEDLGGGSTYLYNSFTPSEKRLFIEKFGEVIPFLPNDEYYVEDASWYYENCLNFYTIGNTSAEYESYRQAFSAYELIETYLDDYGDTCYLYQKGEIYVDMSFYVYESERFVDVYVYTLEGNNSSSGNNSGTNSGETGEGDSTYLYTQFTDAEKQTYLDTIGEVIPFLPNDEYYVEDASWYYENCLNFYTIGNTSAEYESYRQAFSAYELIETYLDDYGDTWYLYQKGEIYVDMSFYVYESERFVDVYVYTLEGNNSSSGNNSGTNGGGVVGENVMTNDGKGLPAGVNGVYDVDFKAATYVKNVTEQGYYEGGCPTVGSPAVLVIPIEFSDCTAQSKGYSTSVIAQAFSSGGQTDYYSVYDYYRISSYGQLTLDITVLDFWFKPSKTSTYYQNATMDYDGTQTEIGDQMIMDEALAYLESRMDLSAFDSDNNGMIDAVVLVNTLTIAEDNFHWAYRYWNIYTDDNDYYYEYDGVSANDYMWASYQFLHEGVDSFGNVHYEDKSAVNTYTYIHEFGHILGADDYYDTAGYGEPMLGYDVMDYMAGDHNAFTKFNYGWVTSSRLVTTDTSVTLTLEDFSKAGDTIILANDWDSTLGAYQEYYVIAYYRSVGLNAGEFGYFAEEGIVVYHVNASLYKEEYYGETYYDVYNNNTSPLDEYGTSNNLIEYVATDWEECIFGVGDSLPEVTDDGGNALGYTFTVDSLSSERATITFTKLN